MHAPNILCCECGIYIHRGFGIGACRLVVLPGGLGGGCCLSDPLKSTGVSFNAELLDEVLTMLRD